MTPFDDYYESPFHGDESIEDPLLVEERWEMIHTYPREQAIEAGVLVPYSLTFHGKTHHICFTRELYDALTEILHKSSSPCVERVCLGFYDFALFVNPYPH